MHAILLSVGTDGDIFPYLQLGRVLRERGHRVTFLASEHYRDRTHKAGLDFEALLSTQENFELFDNPDFWHPFKTAPLCAKWGIRLLPRQYELLTKLKSPDAIIVANPSLFAAGMVHEAHGVPLVHVLLQPGLIPSTLAPPIMPGLLFLRGAPKWVWKLFWRCLDLVGALLIGRELNQMRQNLGLSPMRRIFSNWLSPQLVICWFPDWYGPAQSDWPPQIKTTSFPIAPDSNSLTQEVIDFCNAGEPPVVFTFGTGMRHSAKMFRESVEACKKSNFRGILLTKHRDQLPNDLPKSVLHCPYAPFEQLFPLCAAVVHHGGVGTLAKCLAAGVPQLIRPISFDQFDNGERIRKLGAGDWLETKKPSGSEIAAGLKRLVVPEVKTAAESISKILKKENGLQQAADLIENLDRERRKQNLHPSIS